ncbi:MAG: mannose-1-phosphate guanylyltransferase/mannose-6-phosphate isomerase [Acidobacteria bacterium]|nr:mannose-1-phosphate guanylyltransferase/mannose-6-phosphate isomerase [Acidobacteriota bacterium]
MSGNGQRMARTGQRAPRASGPSPHLYAVILAGGSGTRFWPLSRHLYPKQLLRIIGEETLIQQTMRRVLGCVPAERVLVSTTPAQADSIRYQLGEWKDALRENFVIEPEGRNTAPAIALAAGELITRDPEAVMLVLPADHVIQGSQRFQAAVALGVQLAGQGRLITFGIPPSRPETGYGYIQPNRGKALMRQRGLAGYPVARFVEKPDAKTAARYLKDGHYYWNSGIFLWRAATILEELARHQPGLARAMRSIGAALQAGASDEFSRLYRRLKPVSIDQGVMERSHRAAVIPVDFTWSDVGNWRSLEEVAARDKAGNVVSGKVVDLDSHDSILYADRRLVATIGLSDMVVVDTPDATLVCPKNRSQEVKAVVDMLRQRGAPEHLEHRTVFRPWGSYTVLEEGSGYKVKRVSVNPGGRLSLQLHHQRSEHWVVIAGTARVTCGRRVFELTVGQSTGIPKETPHRLENPGSGHLHLIEVQNGPYLGEDDIVRFHDDYGRSLKR